MLREGFRIVREVFPVVLVAFLVFQLIRVHLCERYLVPSRSMEPTLHGDPQRGDLVLVDKTAWWWKAPQRFDLVVVRNPDQVGGNLLVKRLVSGGGDYVEWLKLDQGDIFVSRTSSRFDRVVKQPSAFHDMRVTAFELLGSASEAEVFEFVHRDRKTIEVDGGAIHVLPHSGDLRVQMTAEKQRERFSGQKPDLYLPGFLSSAQEFDAGFVDADGISHNRFTRTVRDIGFEVDCTLDAGCERLFLVIEHLEVYYGIEYSRAGEGLITVMGVPQAEPFRGPSLPEGERFGFAFGYLDGHLFMEIDGQVGEVLHRRLEVPDDTVKMHRAGPRFANLLHMGFEGGGVRIWRLRGFHDVFYMPSRDHVYRIEPEQIFLLGDNTFDSKDSRVRVTKPFVQDDLVGRPVALIAPWKRLGWLPR